ncbi:MAG TPA: cardiolipin synthase ClsB [Solimonas sp.]|nr:cardiolipin synthase ClsB [Solimonas sp.]
MSDVRWRDGNRIELLENGEGYFPRVFDAIRRAKREVLIETFILFDDPVGRELRQVLIDAARRGVRVALTADGYGSPDLSPEFVAGMTGAGISFNLFDPRPRIFGRYRTNLFRRLHRKLVVVDGCLAFVGGINFSVDHLIKSGPESKQDYAVAIEGPVVADIHAFMLEVLAPTRWWRRLRLGRQPAPVSALPPAGKARAAFVTRDNHGHTEDIERHYRVAIRAARREVIIANAYFFPGYRLLRELRRAARRGVSVSIILQGRPDMVVVRWAASTLYGYLHQAGVHIYEYCERPLHGKVAVVDGEWATVGSSNLDPLSLALNLEANLSILDKPFASSLATHLQGLMQCSCTEIEREKNPPWVRKALGFLAFHVSRQFPAWAGWLPAHTARLKPLAPPAPAPKALQGNQLA